MKQDLVEPLADLLEHSGLPAQDQFEVARFFAAAEDYLIEWFLQHVKVEPTWLTALSQNLRAKKALVQFTSHLTPEELWKKEQDFFQQQVGWPPAGVASV